METIKEGEYSDAKDIVVVVEEDVTIKKTFEASINQIEQTIESLNLRKESIISEIENEIELNKEMLKKISSVDTSKVKLVKKIDKPLI